MRSAILAALAGLVLAGPAFALDKVKFGTNWLADPEAGGFYQAARRWHLCEIRARRDDHSGRPPGERRPVAPLRQDRVLHGRRHDRQSPVGRKQTSADRGRRGLPEEPADFHVASRRRARQMGGPAERQARLCRRRRDPDLLRLAPARLRLQGREHPALQFQFRALHPEQDVDPAGLCHRRALRDRKAGRFQAERLPAQRLRLRHLFDPDRDAPRDRREEPRSRAALRRRLRHRLVSLSLWRQRQGQRA